MRLHVNVDHVATLRNARGTDYPDPVVIARMCEQAGADGITAHLREDRRHMRDADIEALRASVKSLLNLEMAATPEMTAIAARIRPDVITLVPERREERTTEGGLDVFASAAAIRSVAEMCRREHIKLSLFIAADVDQVRQSQVLGAQQIELHTGEYCHSTGDDVQRQLQRLQSAAQVASAQGLEVAAGHGLNLVNLEPVVRIPGIEELNIGHAIIADALQLGIAGSVQAYRECVNRGLAGRASVANAAAVVTRGNEAAGRLT
jgi:pyridoxine 5-phosphate synthase